MTKKELLADLAKNFFKVDSPERVSDDTLEANNFNKYLVGVYFVDERDSSVLHRKNVAFIVENEGNADEKAYYYESNPKPQKPVVDTFREQLNSKYPVVERVLDNGAVVRKVEKTSSGYTEKRVFVDKQMVEHPFVSDIKEVGTL